MPRRKLNPHATSAKEPARDVNRAQRQLQAIELRKQGYQWQEIAEQCGIAGGKAGAYKLVNQALKTNLREATTDFRELLSQRLDDLYRAVSPKALTGDTWSVDRCLAIIDRMKQLHNLDIKPDTLQQQAQMVVIGIPAEVAEAI